MAKRSDYSSVGITSKCDLGGWAASSHVSHPWGLLSSLLPCPVAMNIKDQVCLLKSFASGDVQ